MTFQAVKTGGENISNKIRGMFDCEWQNWAPCKNQEDCSNAGQCDD